MEALGRLTGGVAHDFNNLLMIVGGHVRIVKKLLQDNPRGLQAAEAIETAATRGETLTRQLLAFSRRQPLNPVVAELSQRIDALHTLLAKSPGASIQPPGYLVRRKRRKWQQPARCPTDRRPRCRAGLTSRASLLHI